MIKMMMMMMRVMIRIPHKGKCPAGENITDRMTDEKNGRDT